MNAQHFSTFLAIRKMQIKMSLIPPLPSQEELTKNLAEDVRERNPYSLLIGV
jgi:hypothetical protein